MVEGDGFNDGSGKAPKPQEVAADVRMSGAEGFFFDDTEVDLVTCGFFECVFELIGKIYGEDQLANVVEETAGEGLVEPPLVDGFGAGERFGGGGGFEGMRGQVLE